jgi:hypothetical protein
MAGTNTQAVRTALVTRISGLSALTGVQVAYSGSIQSPQTERVYLGKATAPQQVVAMRGAGGRIKRLESTSVRVHILIDQPGGTEQAAADRAVVLGQAFENDLAGNPTLSITGDDPIKCVVSLVELDTWSEDDAAHADLTYTVEAESYLT